MKANPPWPRISPGPLVLGGSKVLLIDGDLRKGRIHELLKLPSKPGLSELLRENEDPGKFVQATDLPDFAFLARGSTSRNPGDLFLSPAFDRMLARFRQKYDFVLIDSSPVFAADDTSSIAPKVDGALFVVRSRFSHARVVREALELLFQRQARVLGLILNRAPMPPPVPIIFTSMVNIMRRRIPLMRMSIP